jgi:D-amino-acid dehydrogenase
MKVIVLGAGVIGVTTAYYLNKAGYEVEVYDSNNGPAQGTSFANAGQISVGYSAPWAAPGIPLKAMKWMLSNDSPFAFKFDGSMDQFNWVYQFLRNCNKSDYICNKDTMLRLSSFSKECFENLRNETHIEYEGRQLGTLQLFRKENQLLASKNDLDVLDQNNIKFRLLIDKEEIFKIEPALKNSSVKLAGGLYMPGDETGDCNLFTNRLETICKNNGVKFFYNSKIHSLVSDGKKITGMYVDTYLHYADSYVIAAGIWSKDLLRGLGINIPVYPVRGYSLTLDITEGQNAPVSTVLDETNKVAITRFDNRIRVGGFAELGHAHVSKNHGLQRINQLEGIVNELFPNCPNSVGGTHFDPRGLSGVEGGWSGLRPMTPNGIPIIGKTDIENLYLNTGHGTLGWTMSCGSGKMLSEIVSGDKTKLSESLFKLTK